LRVGRGAADSFTAATIHGSNQGCSRDDEALFRGTSFLKSAGRPGGGRHQATSRYPENVRLSMNLWLSLDRASVGSRATVAGCHILATSIFREDSESRLKLEIWMNENSQNWLRKTALM
jgi:hypothetical protein